MNDVVDLSKANRGDTCILRNGSETHFVSVLDTNSCYKYTTEHHGNYTKEGKWLVDVSEHDIDIIKVIPQDMKDAETQNTTVFIKGATTFDIPNLPEESDCESIDFRTQSSISQSLKAYIPEQLEAYQKEALDIIIQNISKIVTMAPNNVGSWKEIAKYANLVITEVAK